MLNNEDLYTLHYSPVECRSRSGHKSSLGSALLVSYLQIVFDIKDAKDRARTRFGQLLVELGINHTF